METHSDSWVNCILFTWTSWFEVLIVVTVSKYYGDTSGTPEVQEAVVSGSHNTYASPAGLLALLFYSILFLQRTSCLILRTFNLSRMAWKCGSVDMF
jgi:hypothetical protein